MIFQLEYILSQLVKTAKEQKMQKITVSFPDEKIKEIMRIARERGESKSTILRMAMELYLRREKREKGDDLLIL
ncbi:unnamed protein product [Brugia timori]|jgi:metal-responsive CopG/Arc/MetJ family transcriptional regulator|uniref:RHH_1 domain-containing protein n=2 Tax=cellular organisms TaxID=131567 RepID=A0A0R3QHC3_9BILA|nr:unnamed protein product [Brugia timori]